MLVIWCKIEIYPRVLFEILYRKKNIPTFASIQPTLPTFTCYFFSEQTSMEQHPISRGISHKAKPAGVYRAHFYLQLLINSVASSQKAPLIFHSSIGSLIYTRSTCPVRLNKLILLGLSEVRTVHG